MASSVADEGSGEAAVVVRAAFSVATTESGLLLDLSGERDAGRLCQDSGLEPGDGKAGDESIVRFPPASGAGSFSSFVGEVA